MKKTFAAAILPLSMFVASAYAAVPSEVTDALVDAKADSLAVAGLALVIVISIAAFKFMRRAV